jgi:hypothetical protein
MEVRPMSDAMKPFVCTSEVELAKSADEVWAWLSDIRNAMTVNQFHVGVDAQSGEARKGLEVPIFHEIVPFPRHDRIARITSYSDDKEYTLGWAERHTLPFPDPFPHGESWTVTAVNAKSCRVTAQVRGAWTTPVGRAIGPYVWDAMFTTTLRKDLQDVAIAVGAIDEREEIEPVPEHDRLHWLTLAHHINDMPAEEYMKSAAPVFGDYAEYMAAHPSPFG